MKQFPRTLILCVAAFMAPAAIIYFVARRSAANLNSSNSALPPSSVARTDTIEEGKGLSVGEKATLPDLKNLSGEPAALGSLRRHRLVCAFFSASCNACAQDADFWRALNREASQDGVDFYLIDVGDDAAAMKQFAENYGITELPILFDPAHHIGRDWRVGFVPQYLLLTPEGTVLHRWDGLRRNDPRPEAEKLAEFFHSY